MSRVRFVAASIQLQLVNDDGETLAHVPTQPIIVPADAWPPDLDAIVADVDRQVNGSEPVAD